MLKKYIIIVDTDKEPFVDCSLKKFLDTVDIIDIEKGKMTKEELEEYEDS